MRRVIALFLLAISTTTFATTEQSLIAAGHAYSSNNINMLANLYSTNKNSPVISYLYARTLLTHMNNNTIAEHYVDYMPNSYMRNDLLHQLLISYYKNDSFSNFKSAYNKLNNSQIFANETCGYDVASIKLDKTYNTLTDLSWLSNNNITNWCADLGLLAYKNNKIPRADFNRMLNNLIIYGDYDSFNKLMPQLQMKPINFYKYKDMPYNRISHNRYLVIKYISNKAKKYPEDALQILNSSNLNEQDKTLLANYIALQFVANQKFAQAVRLFEKYNSNDISNDEFEWRARSYLALGKWSKLITAIKSMPDTLQNKNVWLYWLAKSYDGLGQYSKATYFLKKIPKDYSYYDLLAQGELETPTIFDTTIPKSISLGDSKFASDVNNALTIYRIGKSSHTHILTTIGMFQWYYLTRIATHKQLIGMSLLSRNYGYYDLSISAANKLDTRILYLSFPAPYLNYYSQFSQKMGISSAYLLAISRQESRFNASIVAFDGGQGLMQIMPNTAKYISRKSRYQICSLLTAPCNIKYGSWYLGNLYNKFGSYIYASAGYNGGPNRAMRWQKNLANLDNRIQIEMIPISITRGYIQKVLVNKAIYDIKFNGSNKLDMLNYVINLKNAPHNINNLNDDKTDAIKL